MKIKASTIIIIAIIGIIVYMIYSNISDNISLTKNGVYIVGNIEKIKPGRGGRKLYINYKYRNSTYTADFFDASETKFKPGRWIFKIDSLSPHNFDLEYKYRLPDNLILDNNREYPNLYYFDSVLFGIHNN